MVRHWGKNREAAVRSRGQVSSRRLTLSNGVMDKWQAIEPVCLKRTGKHASEQRTKALISESRGLRWVMNIHSFIPSESALSRRLACEARRSMWAFSKVVELSGKKWVVLLFLVSENSRVTNRQLFFQNSFQWKICWDGRELPKWL